MSKDSKVYFCSNCQAQYPKWVGRCSECGKWGTVSDAPIFLSATKNLPSVSSIKLGSEQNQFRRESTTIKEMDRVLGGGLVEGSVVLLAGDPGIGKSTLVLQLASHFPDKILYVSGEESVEQVGGRLQRLGLQPANLSFVNDQRLEAVISASQQDKPGLLIIDSLQTISASDISGTPGNTNQIKTVTAKLVELAKASNLTTLLIGHVTKGGLVAGPKTLEHLVDVVLNFEGEVSSSLRFLRSSKNRFGPTDEVGIFQMTENGLQEVANPSAVFLANRHQGAGACLASINQGSRSFFIEVQALVAHSRHGQARRTASGFDYNRLQLLLAVLSEKAGIKLSYSDVYINLVGGFKSREPGLDLAVCLALASAYKKRTIPQEAVVIGEVGLGGEVRSVAKVSKVLSEAAAWGLKQVITASLDSKVKVPADLEIIQVKNIAEAVNWLDDQL